MPLLLDCPTCSAPFPAGRSCCPHCHCSSPAWKRWALAATAAASLGAAGCGGSTHSGADAAIHPDASVDLSMPEPVAEYGPALMPDLSESPDGGS